MGYKQDKNEHCLFVHPITQHSVVLFCDDVLCRGSKEVSEGFYAHHLVHYKKEEIDLIIRNILTKNVYHATTLYSLLNATPLKRIDGSHRAADGWALRQFISTTPQVSSLQGKSLYATLVLAVFEVAFLVPGWSPLFSGRQPNRCRGRFNHRQRAVKHV